MGGDPTSVADVCRRPSCRNIQPASKVSNSRGGTTPTFRPFTTNEAERYQHIRPLSTRMKPENGPFSALFTTTETWAGLLTHLPRPGARDSRSAGHPPTPASAGRDCLPRRPRLPATGIRHGGNATDRISQNSPLRLGHLLRLCFAVAEGRLGFRATTRRPDCFSILLRSAQIFFRL